MKRSTRKGVLVMGAIMAAVMTMSSAAYACVVFRGRMEVIGNRGATTVEGQGYTHGYCDPGGEINGRPRTAAAGTAGSLVTIATGPGVACPTYTDTSTNTTELNVLPAGTYLIKFNQGEGNQTTGGSVTTKIKPSYTFDGTYWNMTAQMGCFPDKNVDTTTDLGTMEVLPGGVGVGVVTLDPLYDSTATNSLLGDPQEAYNLCIGEQTPSATTPLFGGRVGLLAPFQLVGI